MAKEYTRTRQQRIADELKICGKVPDGPWTLLRARTSTPMRLIAPDGTLVLVEHTPMATLRFMEAACTGYPQVLRELVEAEALLRDALYGLETIGRGHDRRVVERIRTFLGEE